MPDATPVLPLRVNDLLFITEYLRNGRNGKQAYLVVHPGIKANSAEVGAARLLGQAKVREELARRLALASVSVTRDFVQTHLLRALALAGDDALKITTVCRELGELAGLKVQKLEDVTERAADRQHILDALRTRGLIPSEN